MADAEDLVPTPTTEEEAPEEQEEEPRFTAPDIRMVDDEDEEEEGDSEGDPDPAGSGDPAPEPVAQAPDPPKEEVAKPEASMPARGAPAFGEWVYEYNAGGHLILWNPLTESGVLLDDRGEPTLVPGADTEDRVAYQLARAEYIYAKSEARRAADEQASLVTQAASATETFVRGFVSEVKEGKHQQIASPEMSTDVASAIERRTNDLINQAVQQFIKENNLQEDAARRTAWSLLNDQDMERIVLMAQNEVLQARIAQVATKEPASTQRVAAVIPPVAKNGKAAMSGDEEPADPQLAKIFGAEIARKVSK